MSQKKVDHKKSLEFAVGDTVRVHTKIPEEGGKMRIQMFEGTVISKRGGGTNQTFTVRRISYGEGVERTFPTASPLIETVDVIKKGKVRRAKLYYLRALTGKKAKILARTEEAASEAAEAPVSAE